MKKDAGEEVPTPEMDQRQFETDIMVPFAPVTLILAERPLMSKREGWS